MQKNSKFIFDILLVTLSSWILKAAGIFFSARLSILAGNNVLGIHTQIMSIYAFAATASTAGVNLGTLRITAESYGCGALNDIKSGILQASKYCFKISSVTAVLLFLNAQLLGNTVLGDPCTVPSIRALSAALPFISFSSIFHGYFNGVKRIHKSVFVSVCEQLIRISLTLFVLTNITSKDPGTLCLALVMSNVLAELISCLMIFSLFLFDSKKYSFDNKNALILKKKFYSITVPFAVSALIRSSFTTAEHMLIPIGLKAKGDDPVSALSKYGTVSGMVLPVILFPMALLSSLASLSVTELSFRLSSGEDIDSVSKTVSKALAFTLIYGIGIASILFFFAPTLALSIFHSEDAGSYLRLLAPLTVVMYLDHVSDGMLKGLNKQNYVMKVNIADSLLSVIFAAVLIPLFGIYGFIISVYLCEILNCICSFGMLIRIIKLRIPYNMNPVISVFSSALALFICDVLFSSLALAFKITLVMLLYSIIIFTVSFIITNLSEKKSGKRCICY